VTGPKSRSMVRPGALRSVGPFPFRAAQSDRRRRAVLICGLLLASPVVASSAAVDTATGPSRAPNVLLLTIDTLRPDALGWIGHTNTTPALDALARDGYRFPRALSPAPVTLPAHASILTAKVPRRHGVRDNGQTLSARAGATLAERLAAGGWTTGAFVSGYPLDSAFGLDRGFVHYDDAFVLRSGAGALERGAEETISAALAWIRDAPEPWFLWVHLYDPHDPYEPPPELVQPGPHGAYLGEVVAADRAVGRLRTEIAATSAREVLTLFAADHGESLGEHGEATHGFFVYQSTVEVPLVVHFPGRVRAGESPARVRLVDLAPTALDLLDQPPLPDVDGISLVPWLEGGAATPPPAEIESRRPWLSYGWAPLAALVSGDWKLVQAPRPELYDLSRDPGEAKDRLDEERRRARALATELDTVRARSEPSAATTGDAEALARLESLGYVGAGRASRREPAAGLPDPKDRIELWNLLGEAEAARERGDLTASLALFDRALAREPSNPFAWGRSGRAALDGGDASEATRRLARAVALAPDDPEAHAALATALLRLGRSDDAARAWMEVVRLQPERASAWASLAGALGASGQAARAVAALERASALAPEDAGMTIRLAFARYAAKDIEGAARDLETAARRLGPDVFPHHGALGLLLDDLGRRAEAVEWLERSRPGEPEFVAARLRLAERRLESGEVEAARRALAEALAVAPDAVRSAPLPPELRALLPP